MTECGVCVWILLYMYVMVLYSCHMSVHMYIPHSGETFEGGNFHGSIRNDHLVEKTLGWL